MFFKPAVASPGANILSTYPVPLGSFAVLSGTSQATPFIAGVSALLFGVKGNSAKVGRGARSLFETTAKLVPSNFTAGSPLQTAAQQGAGLINAFQAITTNITIQPSELLTNDSAHFVSLYVRRAGVVKCCRSRVCRHTFTITNNGKQAESFKISHVPAGTALSLQPVSISAITNVLKLIEACAGHCILCRRSRTSIHRFRHREAQRDFRGSPPGPDTANHRAHHPAL